MTFEIKNAEQRSIRTAGPSGAVRWALGLIVAVNLTLGSLALIVMTRTRQS